MPALQRNPQLDPDAALLELLGALKRRDYAFVTPTPATHARVISRPGRRTAHDLADVLGWSLPFEPQILDADLLALLEAAGQIAPQGTLLRATCRVSSLHGHLFLHSAYPTQAEDAVFFGPDSYRFADFIRAGLDDCAAARIVDIGTGAGVGGIVAADACPDARVTLTDINPKALRCARVNAAFAGVEVELLEGDGLGCVAGEIDVAVANPPYIIDAQGRAYRDGGAMHGGRLSLDMAREAAGRLSPGGRLLLYTGSAIVRGHDALKSELERVMADLGCTLDYRELDPDIFGEELDGPGYEDVDRIAVVGAVATKRR
ncbi:MAG: class I SAM-dependent methyltransferase [Sphingomonadaceae bacterium]|nr:class I SAM-dependent methyltransferase [Sphingomonadaceae bacterium]